MKVISYVYQGRTGVGALTEDLQQIQPLLDPSGRDVTNLLEFLRLVPERRVLRQSPNAVPLNEAQIIAPIPRPPRNIFCVGKNYAAHAKEVAKSSYYQGKSAPAAEAPDSPIVFTKAPETVIGPESAVRFPQGVSDSLDYEAELAVVIGKGGKQIPKGRALEHVFGYTIMNDVTARDWQKRHKQWFLGKSFDTFCPMGPWIVTVDSLDPTNLQIQTWINGEQRQNANTKDLIFDIPTLIATISAGITLIPGDIIATGTPEGVGVGFDPPRFLRPGDRMRIEISGIGVLENSVAL